MDKRLQKIVGIVGSLRAGSFNRLLMLEAFAMLPAGAQGQILELHDLPHYNGDVEATGFPEAVNQFREAVRAADGILIATPEYNYSIPGVLKNALDWASRPPDQPFAGKPTAIMGASSGVFGTVRSQSHLRQVLQYLDTIPMQKPELMIGQAAGKFDEQGRLTDDRSRAALEKFIAAFTAWTRRI